MGGFLWGKRFKRLTLKRINFGLKECDITENVCVNNKQHLQLCALKLNVVLAITTCILFLFLYQLTHHVMAKELKHCRHVEDLEVNENVKAKAKDYVKKYMSRCGAVFKKSSSPDDFA